MSDPKRVEDVTRRISQIRASTYPVVAGQDQPYRIEERPWSQVPEPSKLAILQDIDWSGVTNRDRAHILLSEVDPGKISDAQRNTLIDMAMTGDTRDRLARTPEDVKTLSAEIRADEHAARVRDFGEADAATYDARMGEAYQLRSQSPPEPISHDQFLDQAAARMATKPKDKERGHSR